MFIFVHYDFKLLKDYMEVLRLMFQAAHHLPHGLTDAAGYEYAEHDLKVKSF